MKPPFLHRVLAGHVCAPLAQLRRSEVQGVTDILGDLCHFQRRSQARHQQTPPLAPLLHVFRGSQSRSRGHWRTCRESLIILWSSRYRLGSLPVSAMKKPSSVFFGCTICSFIPFQRVRCFIPSGFTIYSVHIYVGGLFSPQVRPKNFFDAFCSRRSRRWTAAPGVNYEQKIRSDCGATFGSLRRRDNGNLMLQILI